MKFSAPVLVVLSTLASAGHIGPQSSDACQQYANYAQNQLQTLGPLLQYEIDSLDASTSSTADNSNTNNAVDNSFYSDSSSSTSASESTSDTTIISETEDNSVHVDNSVDNSDDHSLNIDVSPVFDTDTNIDTNTDIDTDTIITPTKDFLVSLVNALGQVNRATGPESDQFRAEVVQSCEQGNVDTGLLRFAKRDSQAQFVGDVYGAVTEARTKSGEFYGQGGHGGHGSGSGGHGDDGGADEESLGLVSLLDGVLEAVGGLLGGLLG
ncbi:hypothetical protein BJX70DRAFT_304379 [Aspergillus crustosus]